MSRVVRAFLLGSVLAWPVSVVADPPIWDTDYGPDTGLQEDDDYIEVTLGFMFPFDGTDYDTLAINTNGGVTLGVGGVFAGDAYVDYDIWEESYFLSDFADVGNPIILPFSTDLDNGDGPVGTIHFKTDATTAVVTWNGVASHSEDLIPFVTFQLTLESDGTITFGYLDVTADIVLDNSQGIVVGVSNGMDMMPPGSSDLSDSVNADVSAPTNYEIWCYDENMVVGGDCYISDGTRPDNYAFDLEQTNVIFTPNATGGWDISDSAAPPPPPPPIVAGDVQGEYGGCTVGASDGRLDPTLPLLVLISIVALATRRMRGF
jgi:hypothetical protein